MNAKSLSCRGVERHYGHPDNSFRCFSILTLRLAHFFVIVIPLMYVLVCICVLSLPLARSFGIFPVVRSTTASFINSVCSLYSAHKRWAKRSVRQGRQEGREREEQEGLTQTPFPLEPLSHLASWRGCAYPCLFVCLYVFWIQPCTYTCADRQFGCGGKSELLCQHRLTPERRRAGDRWLVFLHTSSFSFYMCIVTIVLHCF